MEKLQAFLNLFRKGKEVANPAAWKNGTIAVNTVVAFLAAVLGIGKVFGYGIELPDEVLEQAAIGIIAFAGVGNTVVHIVTSKKVGLSTTES